MIVDFSQRCSRLGYVTTGRTWSDEYGICVYGNYRKPFNPFYRSEIADRPRFAGRETAWLTGLALYLKIVQEQARDLALD